MAKSQAYRLPIHRNWYKTSISHNTVLMDELQREEGDCQLLLYAASDQYAAAAARDVDAYPGVIHERLIVLTPDYMVVLDDVMAKASHRFNWMYHHAESEMSVDGVRLTATDVAFRGAEYLEGVASGTTDGDFQVRFSGGDVTTALWMISAPNTRVLTADGPGETVLVRLPSLMVTREGASAQFAAVMEPFAAPETSRIRQVSAVLNAPDKTAKIAYGDREDVLVLTADGVLSFTVDGKQVLKGEPWE